MTSSSSPSVRAVHASKLHSFSKFTEPAIRLVAGLGVEGDAHAGTTVKHRSRVARNPQAPNLRQVHLLHAELFDELMAAGFAVWPGELGENITTHGVDLLGQLTGLRNPCSQIDRFQAGLMAATLAHDADGRLVRKAGVMAIVLQGGTVQAGDAIRIDLPAGKAKPLEPV